MSEKSIRDVEDFWNRNPLFTGEALFDPRNPQPFFEEHNKAYFEDVFAGIDIERTFSLPGAGDQVLDLGCGVGFWSSLFVKQYQVHQLVSADLTDEALRICQLRVPNTVTKKENAENLTFSDGSFSHVNCQGVIHHTPDTQACLDEIYRVLKNGGTASVSVYYRNALLRLAKYAIPLVRLLAKLLLKDSGRGRDFSKIRTVDDIVCFYDGSDNPIGKAYDRAEFENMLRASGFEQIEFNYFFFPFRFLNFRTPDVFKKTLVTIFPFMIVANARK